MFDWLRNWLFNGLEDRMWDAACNILENEEKRADLRAVFSEEVDIQTKRLLSSMSGQLKGSVEARPDVSSLISGGGRLNMKGILGMVLQQYMSKGLNPSASNQSGGESSSSKW